MNDDVAIIPSESGMARDVNFINVDKARDLSGIQSDGLLGLSPRNTRRTDEVHLLVDELQKDGIVKDALFAFYLTDENGQSKVKFGAYDEQIVNNLQSKFPNSVGIHWMEQNSVYHW